jgi:hypothetical protein
MKRIAIHLTHHARGWRIMLNVDGQIEPSTVFGCREGLFPLIAGLVATEAQVAAVRAGTQRNMGDAPTLITVTMPSGRELTFRLAEDEQLAANVP